MIKNIILLITLSAVSCFSNRISAAAVTLHAQNETLGYSSQHFPNDDIARLYELSALGRSITGQRNLVPLALPQGIFVYEEQISFTSSIVKTFLLRVKDYLHHIHPSHHFW